MFNFEVTDLDVTGIYGDEVTPVPIPNTEVKLISVENTWLATAWEDRAMPVQKLKSKCFSVILLLSSVGRAHDC